jgi:hypothetical protein
MFTLIRIASVLAVVGLHVALPRQVISLFFAILFCHYGLALWYARRRIKEVTSAKTSPLVQVALMAGIALLPYLGPLPLVIYFGFHHALTEAYMVATRRGGMAGLAALDPAGRRLLVARAALALSGYYLMVCRDDALNSIPYQALVGLVGVCFVGFLVAYVPAARGLPLHERVDLVGFELAGLALSLCALRVPISFGCGSFMTAGNPAKFPYLTRRRRGCGIGSGTSPSA